MTPSERSGAAGFGDGGQDEELRLELQQRDTIIQMKTEEIRRLSLHNHDLENEVDLISFGNDVVAKTEDKAGRLEEGRQGEAHYGESAAEGG